MARRARSRIPEGLERSIESSRVRASAGERTGVLPCLTTYLGPRTGAAGFKGSIWPTTQVVEEGPEGGEVLLHGRQGMMLLHLLDVAGDGEGGDIAKGQLPGLAPPEEAPGRGGIGLPGIGVSDLGGEELEQAPLCGGPGGADGPG